MASAGSRLERLERALAVRAPRWAERDEPYKEAAVALLLRPAAAGDADLLLIRRATRAGDPWSGQIGLPGGRLDPRDDSLLTTALRETAEEVGLDLRAHAAGVAPLGAATAGRVLGALDELRPRTPVLPPIIVRPFVCVVPDAPPLRLSDEVAEARWVPLGELLAPDARHETTVEVRDLRLRVSALRHGDFTVWGMTERILTGFEEVWR